MNYSKWFEQDQVPMFKKLYKTANYELKRKIKETIYQNKDLTEKDKDRFWREIVR